MDPIKTRDRIKIAGAPYSVQLDRPDCPSLVIGCKHQRALREAPSGIWGSGVRLTRKARPQGDGDIAGRSWNTSKQIGLSITSWVDRCNCHPDECVDFHEITAAFSSLDKTDATFTYSDAKGSVYRFTGRPIGSQVTRDLPDCVEIRASFLATDPLGYGPLRCCQIEVGPGLDLVPLSLWNHGSVPANWWFEVANPDAFDGGPVTWSIAYGTPIPGTDLLQTTFADAQSRERPIPLAKGKTTLRLITEPTTPTTVTVCYREGWI